MNLNSVRETQVFNYSFTVYSSSEVHKHFALDEDEVKVLLECYKALYPTEEIELTSCVARKFTSVVLGTEKFGSKMDCRKLRSARIMASLDY